MPHFVFLWRLFLHLNDNRVAITRYNAGVRRLSPKNLTIQGAV